MSRTIIVVGAGAAGLMAASAAAEAGGKVTLLEKNEKPGKKIYITGKGRCNLTNACDTSDFFGHVVRNPKFLYSAIYGYDQFMTMDFFQKNGCPVKTERGDRVFPVSNHASDVTKALVSDLRKRDVQIRYNTKVMGLLTDGGGLTENGGKVIGVRTDHGEELYADAVIVCTGGKSYPTTGSTGDGLRFAKKLGLQVVEMTPSLVSFNVKESWCTSLQGLALKNVEVSITPIQTMEENAQTSERSQKKKKKSGKLKPVYTGFGEMLFTHFGVSGPLLLTASCYCDFDRYPQGYRMKLDCKPALTTLQLTERIKREVEKGPKKRLSTLLRTLFPARMAEAVAELSAKEISLKMDVPVGQLTGAEIEKLAEQIKNIPITLVSARGFPEAIVSRGGIDVKEIDPSTMECKSMEGLYFAGETLDVDAHTGGFNLQIAWSTGHLAGMSAAQARV